MRVLASATLVFEAIVIGLAALVSVFGPSGSGGMSGASWLLVATLVLALVAPALFRYPWAYNLGWVVQAGAIAGGLWAKSDSMVFIGVIFAILYFFALRLGRRGDAISAAHRAGMTETTAADGASGTPPPVD